MERFVLSDVCNELLSELNKDPGKKNIVKLGVDIQLPKVYYGNPDGFVNALWLLCSQVAHCLINGIIAIELTMRQQYHSEVTVHIQISGHGAGSVVRDLQLATLNENLGFEINQRISQDQIRIDFNYRLQSLDFDIQAAAIPFAGKRILLVEDNEVNAMVFDSFLEEWGCLNTLVVNGAQAVASAQELTFDAVLMDIHMPVLDGIQATKKIREFNRSLPIIALTASTREIDIQEVMDAGATDYLLKPVSSAHIFQVLSKYLIQTK